jgi:SAM-dependent methyltransferase
MKDTNFYNAESVVYSQKRYPEKTIDYIHYFFKKRLAIVLDLIEETSIQRRDLRLLEIGCADGVVIRKIEEKFGDRFSEVQGIDLSPQMIEMARKNNPVDVKIKFAVRKSDDNPGADFDIIVEVGVINYTDFLPELEFVQKKLNPNGSYILSIAGRDALKEKLGRTNIKASNNLLNYADYEKMIIEHFDIAKVVPCGFWLPGLWKIPALARIIQPVLDPVLSVLLPNFFHEKVFLLKLKK